MSWPCSCSALCSMMGAAVRVSVRMSLLVLNLVLNDRRRSRDRDPALARRGPLLPRSLSPGRHELRGALEGVLSVPNVGEGTDWQQACGESWLRGETHLPTVRSLLLSLARAALLHAHGKSASASHCARRRNTAFWGVGGGKLVLESARGGGWSLNVGTARMGGMGVRVR